jgi:hypothetical protein
VGKNIILGATTSTYPLDADILRNLNAWKARATRALEALSRSSIPTGDNYHEFAMRIAAFDGNDKFSSSECRVSAQGMYSCIRNEVRDERVTLSHRCPGESVYSTPRPEFWRQKTKDTSGYP